LQDRDPEIDVDVARDILRYFLRNPRAADDLEGVVRWRLLDEKIHRSVAEARAALEWLVSSGLLVEEQAGTSSAMYRLNVDSREQAERFLEELGTREKNEAEG
jgi:hypothetical protein